MTRFVQAFRGSRGHWVDATRVAAEGVESLALVMVMVGRRWHLDQLTGDGVPRLAERLG